MKAYEIYNHFKSMDSGWVKWGGRTNDTFKAGNPEDEITGIAVSWMGFTWALKETLKLKCNMFISHEPTFHSDRDDDYYIFRDEIIKAKRQLVEDNGLIILRCHDLWDKMPKFGITDSWAEFLGFKNPIAGEGSYRIFDVSGLTALKVAKKIAKCVKETGQDAVELVGPADVPVSRVAIGAGADTPLKHLIDKYKVDLVVCVDDDFVYWDDGALAIDMGIPVIVVNHLVAENPGMKRLSEYLRNTFPQIPVHFISQRCMFQLVHG